MAAPDWPRSELPATSLQVLRAERQMVRGLYVSHGWAWPRTQVKGLRTHVMEDVLAQEARDALRLATAHSPDEQDTLDALRAYIQSIRGARTSAVRSAKSRTKSKRASASAVTSTSASVSTPAYASAPAPTPGLVPDEPRSGSVETLHAAAEGAKLGKGKSVRGAPEDELLPKARRKAGPGSRAKGPCAVCGQVLDLRFMERHQIHHTGASSARPHACPECAKVGASTHFPTLEAASIHLRVLHRTYARTHAEAA